MLGVRASERRRGTMRLRPEAEYRVVSPEWVDAASETMLVLGRFASDAEAFEVFVELHREATEAEAADDDNRDWELWRFSADGECDFVCTAGDAFDCLDSRKSHGVRQ